MVSVGVVHVYWS